jgi:hypothetical protein
MNETIVFIFTILVFSLLAVNFFVSYSGLYKKTYEIHPFTGSLWVLNNALAAIFLFASGNFVTGLFSILTGILALIALLWSMKNLRGKKAKWRITTADWTCLFLAITALVLYRLTGDVTIAAAVAFAGGVITSVPMLRKVYVAPRTDMKQLYAISAMRHLVMTGTLQEINLVGLFPTFFAAIVSLLQLAWVVFCQRRIAKKPLATVEVEVDNG